MLAEQAGLNRKSAGMVLRATISANTDEFAGGSASTTPWRVMSWTNPPTATPVMVDGAVEDLRAELEDMRIMVRQLLARLDSALNKLP
jgi:hypothetical protein